MATTTWDNVQSVNLAAALVLPHGVNALTELPNGQDVCCPNCGAIAHRSLLEQWGSAIDVQQTECPSCDYLMVTSIRTGQVLEAYAPGRWAR